MASFQQDVANSDKPPSIVADAVREAFRASFAPKTLMLRAICVLVPALVLCLARLGCHWGPGHCESVGIHSRTFLSLVFGIPIAPLVHTTNAALGIDLYGWLTMASLLTKWGTPLFSFGVLFLAIVSGTGTWLFGSVEFVHSGTAGILFGIFGFNLCILPFKRPVTAANVGIFVVFDLAFGGMFWIFNYKNPDAHFSQALALNGLLAGFILGFLYFYVLDANMANMQEALAERAPLLHSGLKATEDVTVHAIDSLAEKGLGGLGHAATAADGTLAVHAPGLHSGLKATGDASGRMFHAAADQSLEVLEEVAHVATDAAAAVEEAASAAVEGGRSSLKARTMGPAATMRPTTTMPSIQETTAGNDA